MNILQRFGTKIHTLYEVEVLFFFWKVPRCRTCVELFVEEVSKKQIVLFPILASHKLEEKTNNSTKNEL